MKRDDGTDITKVALEWNEQEKRRKGRPTQLEKKTNGRAEREKHHEDGMQENHKIQDETESTCGRHMFHLGMKRIKRERKREKDKSVY